jgi:hypothetical protein
VHDDRVMVRRVTGLRRPDQPRGTVTAGSQRLAGDGPY